MTSYLYIVLTDPSNTGFTNAAWIQNFPLATAIELSEYLTFSTHDQANSPPPVGGANSRAVCQSPSVSLREPWLVPRPGHVGFLVDKVAMQQSFPQYFGFPVIIIHSSTTDPTKQCQLLVSLRNTNIGCEVLQLNNKLSSIVTVVLRFFFVNRSHDFFFRAPIIFRILLSSWQLSQSWLKHQAGSFLVSKSPTAHSTTYAQTLPVQSFTRRCGAHYTFSCAKLPFQTAFNFQ